MWEIVDILKIFKSIKLLMKMKNVSFILQKKTKNFLANPVQRNSQGDWPAKGRGPRAPIMFSFSQSQRPDSLVDTGQES